jgi:hypothetical protein
MTSEKNLLPLLLLVSCTDPLFVDLTDAQRQQVTQDIEYVVVESYYVEHLVRSAEKVAVFGYEEMGPNGFLDDISCGIGTLYDFYAANKIVGVAPIEFENAETKTCFYYYNPHTKKEFIVLRTDHIDAGIVPTDCYMHEAIHACAHKGHNDAHDEVLLEELANDRYETENYYTSEVAEIVIDTKDVAYLSSFYFFDADLVHGSPDAEIAALIAQQADKDPIEARAYIEEHYMDQSVEDWAQEMYDTWYSSHVFLATPFDITGEEYYSALMYGMLYEDIRDTYQEALEVTYGK